MPSDPKTPDQQPVDDSSTIQQAPADALSRTPGDLEEEKTQAAAASPSPAASRKTSKKSSALRRFLRRINVYFLLFVLITAIVGAYMVVSYLNSQTDTPTATIEPQELTEEALKDLANTDASVGSPSQTLTIQGNAIIDGQTLMRGNLNVAGNFQTGGSIQSPGLTISGNSNLGSTQINNLQVAQDTAIEGNTSMRDLSVSGAASFAGAVNTAQLTVSRLIMSGNGVIEIPNHLSFTGPTPGRSISPGVLGAGGSATVNGSDTSGTVNVNTGSGPSAGCFIRVIFARSFSSQPHVLVTPVGAAAGQTQHYVERDQSGFSICTANPAPAGQSFAFDYFVTG